MTEHIFTNYNDAANTLRIKDLKQSLYDDGEVIMDQVLVCLHGEEHKKRRGEERRLSSQCAFTLSPSPYPPRGTFLDCVCCCCWIRRWPPSGL